MMTDEEYQRNYDSLSREEQLVYDDIVRNLEYGIFRHGYFIIEDVLEMIKKDLCNTCEDDGVDGESWAEEIAYLKK